MMGADSFNGSRTSAIKGTPKYESEEAVESWVLESIRALSLAEDFIRPGDRVVLKPNWVKEHDERFPGPDRWEHVVTHPFVIRAVIRWVARFLEGQGNIVICDAPQTDSSFQKIRLYCRLDEVVGACRQEFPGLEIQLLDLRPEEWCAVDGVTVSKTELPGDPHGMTHVRLNENSEFVGFSGLGNLFGASYNMEETNEKHSGNTHEYQLCRTPMDADVFINIPKLKTHKKVGVTCALKNLVGINANKNWLPHHTEGAPEQGGDQFPKLTRKTRMEHSWMGAAKRFLRNRRTLSRLFVPLKKLGRLYFGDTQKVVRSGNWHGNDTCWRMVLDLNKCLFFYNGAGERRKKPMRYLAVVDGIIGGEGNGPMAPDPKESGVIICGTHPAAVDCAAAAIMGFDRDRIRLLNHAFQIDRMNFVSFTSDSVQIHSNHKPWDGPLNGLTEHCGFRPHFGWLGAIETPTRELTA